MKSELIEAATGVRGNAYAIHSGYSVGAAVLGSDGLIYVGCNVENDSYGLSVCAERNAVAAMVAKGCTTAVAIAIATSDGGFPCGACRQVLSQFEPLEGEMAVYLIDGEANVNETTLSKLLPSRFRL